MPFLFPRATYPSRSLRLKERSSLYTRARIDLQASAITLCSPQFAPLTGRFHRLRHASQTHRCQNRLILMLTQAKRELEDIELPRRYPWIWSVCRRIRDGHRVTENNGVFRTERLNSIECIIEFNEIIRNYMINLPNAIAIKLQSAQIWSASTACRASSATQLQALHIHSSRLPAL